MRSLLMVLLLSTGAAVAQEEKVVLKDAPGRDKAMQCLACHSLDYINKMINAFGAPIPKEDVDAIATYLNENYGKK